MAKIDSIYKRIGMIERFNPYISSDNPIYKKFSIDHINRYKTVAGHLKWLNNPSLTVVDAACGIGYGGDILNSLCNYIGVDKSTEGFGSRFSYIKFCRTNISKPDCLSRYQPDIIVSFETAEHLLNPGIFINSCAIALKSKSAFFFSVPTSLTMDFDPYHLHDWDVRIWRTMLEIAGFRIVESTCMPIEGRFIDFLNMIPTSFSQKFRVFWYDLTHRRYLVDRMNNWLFKNRFYWESTMFICERK